MTGTVMPLAGGARVVSGKRGAAVFERHGHAVAIGVVQRDAAAAGQAAGGFPVAADAVVVGIGGLGHPRADDGGREDFGFVAARRGPGDDDVVARVLAVAAEDLEVVCEGC